MVECQKCLDPTSLGLFLVAAVSLPLALVNLIQPVEDVGPTHAVFVVLGILILFVAYFAYKADANFGFVVFGLVGAAVVLTGIHYGNAVGMGAYANVTFAIIFLLSLIWSFCAKTPKNLSLILVTTTLIFLFVGLSGLVATDSNAWAYLIGIAALFNFLFSIYLAFALALGDKLKVW